MHHSNDNVSLFIESAATILSHALIAGRVRGISRAESRNFKETELRAEGPFLQKTVFNTFDDIKA